MTARRTGRVLPGFRLALGFTIAYLALVVVLPLTAVVTQAGGLGWRGIWRAVSTPRVLAALRLSVGAALVAGAVSVVLGLVLAWVLARYRFPGRRVLDALVDLPFALPTAVAGIALTALYSPNGWIGRGLAALGVQVAFAPAGVVVALVFVGLPFVVRTVQPVLADLDREVEEGAASLGARRWQAFWRVLLPTMRPALLTGFALAFARGVGEYGSVVFVAGNMPMRTEIAPLLIMTKLEQYDYAGAAAVAATLLVISLVLLAAINLRSTRVAQR